jgi:hypothetical protein
MELYDPNTGEVRVWEREEPIKRRGRMAGQITQAEFAILYDEHLPRLFTLTATELRVFLALIDGMGFNGPFRYSTAELADQVEAHPNSVSRALSSLRRQGFIIEVGHREIYLDPRIIWRGDNKDRKIAIDRLEKDGLLVKRIVPPTPEEEGDTL